MAKLLKVRLSEKARSQAVADLGDTIVRSERQSLTCELSGLPIYSFDLGNEADLEALKSGHISHAKRVGWRYFAAFDSNLQRQAALLDYAKRASGEHELWKLDHAGDHFVSTLRSACAYALNARDCLRYAPRLILLPDLRWSTIWMAEKSPQNDIFSTKRGQYLSAPQCAELILEILGHQPKVIRR